MPPLTAHPVSAPTSLQVGALPGGKIVLHWLDTSLDETGFRIERVQGITGTTWTEIATLAADTTTYTEQPSLLGESYWYCVVAYNATGVSAYSNEAFNSTFAAVPNPDELYLMTLINEARADPMAAGYANYPAVPPLVYHPLVAASAHSHSQSILNSGFQFGHCDSIGRCATGRASHRL